MGKLIAITADLHYGNYADDADINNYVSELEERGADVLIIAGDLATYGATHESFIHVLSLLCKFSGKILFTPGNHDLWAMSDSFTLYDKVLPAILKEAGIHLLDGNPYVTGNLGIVGTVGWYDYSFRFVPESLRKIFADFLFKFDENNKDKVYAWDELTAQHYESKTCYISKDGMTWKKSTWEDAKYIKWDFSDKEFLNICLERLKNDIKSVYSDVEEIIAVSHHLPFAGFVPDIPEPVWGFNRAYLGSEKIGRLLLKYPKIKFVFFGHSHRNNKIVMRNLTAVNVFFHKPPGTFYRHINEA